ncbi:protein kinase [Chamberlinius hualienensis]
MTSSADWELCKENIKPLKQGRKMEVLQSTVEPDMQYLKQKLAQEQKRYESLIRMYKGEDPLDGWHQYVEWIEQNFPKGGKATGLENLLHECILKFKDEERYKNDPRFVAICLKFATSAPNPVETYQYMYAEKLGIKVADFFRVWANHLESTGNLRDADGVIKEGLRLNAEPRNDLLLAQNHLTARSIRCVTNSELEVEQEPERTALGGLKSFGSKHKVGVTRTGIAKQKEVKLQQQGNMNKIVVPQTKVRPHCDDNQTSSIGFHRRPNDVKSQLVVSRNQENEMNPTKWTSVKVPLKSVQEAPKPVFDVHIDPQASQEMLKKMPVVNDMGLSVSKKAKSADDRYQLKAKPNPENQVFMYCKDKLTSGTTEFQFEELRAIMWKQKHNLMTKKCEEINSKKQGEKMQVLKTFGTTPVILANDNMQKFSNKAELHSSIGDAPIISTKPVVENLSCQSERSSNASIKQSVAGWETSGPKSAAPYESRLSMQQQKMPEVSKRGLIENANPMAFAQTVEVTQPIPLTSFINVLWNQTVADPILEFIKEESHLLKESSNVIEEETNEKPKFAIFQDPEQLPKQNLKENVKGAREPTEVKVYYGDEYLTKESRNENGSQVSHVPKFTIFQDDDYSQNKLCQENETRNRGKPTFNILGENNDHLRPNLPNTHNNIREMRISFEDRENVAKIPVQSDVYVVDERNLGNLPPVATGFTCEDLEVLHPNVEMSMTCPSTTLFLKNLQISSTPSKKHYFGSTTRNDQVGSGASGRPVGIQQQSYSSSDNTGYFHRRNSIFESAQNPYDLSPIPETSREYKSSSSSGMSSTGGAALSSCRTFRSKTQDELSSIAEKTCESFSSRLCIENPYNEAAIDEFFQKLSYPLHKREGYITCVNKIPSIHAGKTINLGNDGYEILDVCGCGAFAKVFAAYPILTREQPSNKSRNKVALKVQTPGCPWEFYISNELINRIKQLSRFYNVLPSIMKVQHFYHFINASVIATDYNSHGSLLQLVNQYKLSHKNMPEVLVIYLTIELLNIIEQIHACNIIHGDVKPDNILIMGMPTFDLISEPWIFNEIFGKSTTTLKIVDYGRSLDKSLFPPNAVFTYRVLTDGFVCPAMLDQKPWTFHGDLYGVAVCINVMLFGEYLKINKCGSKWIAASKLKRYWHNDIWEPLLDVLINIPDFDDLPDLPSIITSLKTSLLNRKMLNEMKQALLELPAVMSTPLK